MRTALGLLLLASLASAQPDAAYRPAFSETFETLELGELANGEGGWQVMQQTDTRATIEELDGAKVLRIFDNHQALEDATCRLRHMFDPARGPARITLRMMMTRGEADSVRQDMGLHLYDGGTLLLDLFFSGSELKTWQGPNWASLDPPLQWEDGRWYDIELLLDAPMGTCGITIDGASHGEVKLRGASSGLSMVELTSQRSAVGETWFDDIRISSRVPDELLAKPSDAWNRATERKKQASWFADAGSAAPRGVLQSQPDKLSSMRRLIAAQMDRAPILSVDVQVEGDAEYTLYAIPTDGRPPELLEIPSSRSDRLELDLFALTGWSAATDVELLVSARGEGRVTVGGPETENLPPADYLKSPSAAWRFVDMKKAPNRLPDSVELPVTGAETGATRLANVSQGIPFPEGALHRTDAIALQQGDEWLPSQTQVLSLWRDGSVRWLLVEGLVDLPPSGETVAQLRHDGRVADAPTVAGERAGQIRLRTEALDLAVPAQSFGPITGLPKPLSGAWDMVARFDDREFRASDGEYSAYIETNGTLRATVVIEGTLSDDTDSPFTYEIRLTGVQGMPHLTLEPTFTLVTDATEIQLQEMTLEFGGTPDGAVTFGAEEPIQIDRGSGDTTLVQDTRDTFAVTLNDESVASGERAAGWVNADGITIGVRRFWQQFAKGLSVSNEGFRVELWSPGAPPRRFGRGAAKTHQILMSFGDDANIAASDFEHPPTLYPGAQWYFDSLGMGHFPIPSDEHAEMDAIYEAALVRRFAEQERLAATSYDMVHYGDINHINNEIDANKAFFMQWARTGERKWLDFALDWALHSQDIDVCHYSPDAREIGIHHSHYPSDHNNGGLTLTHTWIEGQLFRYYLTGDRRSLMAADLAGQAFSRSMLTSGQMFDAGKKGAGIGSRAYGRACWALCELYRATHNPRYLWTMKRLTGFLIDGLAEDGAVGVNHAGSGRWSTTDECPHMAAICAVGLARYAELTGDKTVLDGLERIAGWQMARGTMPEKLGIMYHTYQGGEVIHFVDACSDMLEAWAYLYDETGNPLYRDFAESVYDNMIEMRTRWQNDWTMGIHTMLFYLGRRDKWDAPEPSTGGGDTVEWLRSCQNADGGFGLAPGLLSDMDSTYRAVDALATLGQAPTDGQACVEWVLSCRNNDGGYAIEPGWHSNVAWTHFALIALDRLGHQIEDGEATTDWLLRASNDDGGNGASPVAGKLAYHGAWYSSCEYTAYKALALGELSDGAREFIGALQTDAGGFTHRPGGAPFTGYTLDAIRALGNAPNRDACVVWLRGLRREDGGYGFPGSDRSTLRNTAHCVMALAELSEAHHEPEQAAAYMGTCKNPDGGYGHAPGRTSTVTDTWYAIGASDALER